MNLPFIEDWWEANEPNEDPALFYGDSLAVDLFWIWWQKEAAMSLCRTVY